MTASGSRRRREVIHTVGITVAAVAMAVVLVVDIATGLWQDVVILSGVVAGLLTFILTALFLDRLLARSQHARWLPVTRLALTDLAHALADEDASEITRGRIVPRSLAPPAGGDGVPSAEVIDDLLHRVVAERSHITEAMGRWSAFLAASSDAQELMLHIADIARRLDAIRDTAVEAERGDADEAARLTGLIGNYNASVAAASAEITSLLET